MKNAIVLAALMAMAPATHAQEHRLVHHCHAVCVALNARCGSEARGEVHGFSRLSNRAAFASMAAQCNGRARGVGILLASVEGFSLVEMRSFTEEYRSHLWLRWWWGTRAWRWAETCSQEIHGTPATAADGVSCELEDEDDIDVPYSGTLPILD
jgi:hypothetical protein